MDKETKRRKARAFLREFSTRDDWFVLDTETTGPDEGTDEVVEVAVLDADGLAVTETLVNPSCEISEGAKQVHGIGPEDVGNAPTMKDLCFTLRPFLRRETVLIYNRSFDGPILENSFQRRGVTVDREAWDLRCVMKAYAMAEGAWSEEYGSYRWVKLRDACEERDVSLSGLELHSAAGDAELTRRLVRSFADESEPEPAKP